MFTTTPIFRVGEIRPINQFKLYDIDTKTFCKLFGSNQAYECQFQGLEKSLRLDFSSFVLWQKYKEKMSIYTMSIFINQAQLVTCGDIFAGDMHVGSVNFNSLKFYRPVGPTSLANSSTCHKLFEHRDLASILETSCSGTRPISQTDQ